MLLLIFIYFLQQCGCLNKNDLYKFIYLNARSLVGKVWSSCRRHITGGGSLGFKSPQQAEFLSLFLQLADKNLGIQAITIVPVYSHAPWQDGHELTL